MMRRSAFSLLELVVSLAIVSVVMMSISSAVMLASRAIPSPGDAAIAAPRTATLLGELAEELRYALHFTERSDHAATWIVPDRDGDGQPERLRYEWIADTPGGGGSLTRQYNLGPAIVIADDVHEFTLDFETRQVTETYPGPVVEDAMPTLLASHLSANRDETLTGSTWSGQYLGTNDLTLDPAAESWRAYAVRARLKGVALPGLFGIEIGRTLNVRAELRLADASSKTPTSTVLTGANAHSSTLLGLSSYNWRSFIFQNAPKVAIDQPTAIVIRSTTGGAGGYVLYDNDNGSHSYLETDQGDSDWDYRDGEALTYELWGYQSIRQPDQQLTRQYVSAVDIALRLGEDAAQRQTTATDLPNRPQTLDLRWQSDAIPPATTIDLVRDDFVRPVTAYVRFRNKGPGAATFRINVEWRGDGRCAAIHARLTENPDLDVGGQILTVGCGDQVLLVREGLSNGFQTIRLLIDPTRSPGTVNVQINGEADGDTFRYARTAVVHDERVARIESGPAAQWEFVAVHVGAAP